MEVRHKIHGGVGKAVRPTQKPALRVEVVWHKAKPGVGRYPLLKNLVFRVPCVTRKL